MLECSLCNKQVKNTKGLSEHLKYHNLTLFDYLNMSREIPKCPICNNNCKRYQSNFRSTCGSNVCVTELSKSRIHTSETKEHLRQKRIDYLKKKTGKTAWERRSRKEMSYLENWFQEEVILKHSLQTKHQIITEHFVGGYFIDFAFLDKMLAVEIDGRCHFDKEMIRRDNDFRKDAQLQDLGWQVIRMNFYDIRHKPDELIARFLNVLNHGDSESLEWIGQMRYTEFKKTKVSQSCDKLERNVKIEDKINNVLKENIDFSRHGWVQKVSNIIGITPQKTRSWLEKHAPNLIEHSFKRK